MGATSVQLAYPLASSGERLRAVPIESVNDLHKRLLDYVKQNYSQVGTLANKVLNVEDTTRQKVVTAVVSASSGINILAALAELFLPGTKKLFRVLGNVGESLTLFANGWHGSVTGAKQGNIAYVAGSIVNFISGLLPWKMRYLFGQSSGVVLRNFGLYAPKVFGHVGRNFTSTKQFLNATLGGLKKHITTAFSKPKNLLETADGSLGLLTTIGTAFSIVISLFQPKLGGVLRFANALANDRQRSNEVTAESGAAGPYAAGALFAGEAGVASVENFIEEKDPNSSSPQRAALRYALAGVRRFFAGMAQNLVSSTSWQEQLITAGRKVTVGLPFKDFFSYKNWTWKNLTAFIKSVKHAMTVDPKVYEQRQNELNAEETQTENIIGDIFKTDIEENQAEVRKARRQVEAVAATYASEAPQYYGGYASAVPVRNIHTAVQPINSGQLQSRESSIRQAGTGLQRTLPSSLIGEQQTHNTKPSTSISIGEDSLHRIGDAYSSFIGEGTFNKVESPHYSFIGEDTLHEAESAPHPHAKKLFA